MKSAHKAKTTAFLEPFNSPEIREQRDERVNEEFPEMMNPQTLKCPEQRDACGQTMETDSMDELHKKSRWCFMETSILRQQPGALSKYRSIRKSAQSWWGVLRKIVFLCVFVALLCVLSKKTKKD